MTDATNDGRQRTSGLADDAEAEVLASTTTEARRISRPWRVLILGANGPSGRRTIQRELLER